MKNIKKVKGPIGFALLFAVGVIIIFAFNKSTIAGRLWATLESLGWYFICKKGFDKWSKSQM